MKLAEGRGSPLGNLSSTNFVVIRRNGDWLPDRAAMPGAIIIEFLVRLTAAT